MATGIVKRHSRSCASRKDPGAGCTCPKGAIRYEAWVYSSREGKKIRKSFPTESAAKAWRADSSTAVRKGTMTAPTRTTVREAAAAWLAGAKDGIIRARSGDLYKPSAIRAYEAALRLRVLPAVGHMRLSEVTRLDLQDFVDEMLAGKPGKRQPLNPSTIGCTLLPLRGIYARAMDRGEVAVNPTAGLRLPAVRGGRDHIVPPVEAARLLDALPAEDRPIWATAMYAGLRRGEIQALRWGDVDLAAGVIRVERSWDCKVGPVSPKSAKGRRKVPVAAVLRDYLLEHRMRVEDPQPDRLVFGRHESVPFNSGVLTSRADAAWRAAGLERVILHECRHTFASLMIAAGVNIKALSTYMGHANISITLDRYGHMLPGNEDEAAGLLDAYLAKSTARPDGVIPSRVTVEDYVAMERARAAVDLTGAPSGAHGLSEQEIPA